MTGKDNVVLPPNQMAPSGNFRPVLLCILTVCYSDSERLRIRLESNVFFAKGLRLTMKIIKSAARMAVFFVLLACLLDAAGRLLQDKTSITQLKPFLEDAQEYDVLFVGDSQVLNSILPLELYHQYGITSYNLGARNSLVPMSYWRLINALDYATPRLVVFSEHSCYFISVFAAQGAGSKPAIGLASCAHLATPA